MAFGYREMCLNSNQLFNTNLNIFRELPNLIFILKYDKFAIESRGRYVNINLVIFDRLSRMKFMCIYIVDGSIIHNAILILMAHRFVIVLPCCSCHCL